MTTATTTNKPATIVGCAIGDALGVPWEMKSASNPNLLAWDGLFKDGATFHKWSKADVKTSGNARRSKSSKSRRKKEVLESKAA